MSIYKNKLYKIRKNYHFLIESINWSNKVQQFKRYYKFLPAGTFSRPICFTKKTIYWRIHNNNCTNRNSHQTIPTSGNIITSCGTFSWYNTGSARNSTGFNGIFPPKCFVKKLRHSDLLIKWLLSDHKESLRWHSIQVKRFRGVTW